MTDSATREEQGSTSERVYEGTKLIYPVEYGFEKPGRVPLSSLHKEISDILEDVYGPIKEQNSR